MNEPAKSPGLVYDRYGDFDGFILKTEDGEWHYRSRERDVADLAARAWRERYCCQRFTPIATIQMELKGS